MPELPEVETARLQLERWLTGRRIERAIVPPSRLLRDQAPAEVVAILRHATVEQVARRGKHLLLELDQGRGLYLHLGMTGKLVLRQGSEVQPHARLVLELGPERVIFRDPRLFGRIAAGSAEALRAEYFAPLGPDALLEPPTADSLAEALARTARPLKVALMEQSIIAGLGNIQAVEALFRARLGPTRVANSLDRRELAALARGIRATLAYTLRHLDQDEVRYLSDGEANPFWVYERGGAPCRRCGTPIAHSVQGGRSTYHCPSCQLSEPRPARGPGRAPPRRRTPVGRGRSR